MPGAPHVHMLRAMITVLIVVGVILFLLLDAYVIARVFRSRASADDYASIAVPGETTVTVPAGKLKLTYQESYNAPSTGDGDIEFGTPSALQVTVTSATGEALEVKGPGFRGMGSSLSTGGGKSRALIGTAEVPAGAYTITARPELPDAVEPQVLVGK
jgi:hypothetical protein